MLVCPSETAITQVDLGYRQHIDGLIEGISEGRVDDAIAFVCGLANQIEITQQNPGTLDGHPGDTEALQELVVRE